MSADRLKFLGPVTLVGGGTLGQGALDVALKLAPHLVAADGAGDRLAAMGLTPAAIIGDLDSLADPAEWHGGQTTVLPISEQDTTDFEKCLYATDAPGYVGVGFTGRRVDHLLAVFHAMLRRAETPVMLIGENDVIAITPEAGLSLSLRPGARVSIYPLVPVTGVESEGLRWPVNGLQMETGRQIGTSNIADAAQIRVRFDRRGALIILPKAFAAELARKLGISP